MELTKDIKIILLIIIKTYRCMKSLFLSLFPLVQYIIFVSSSYAQLSNTELSRFPESDWHLPKIVLETKEINQSSSSLFG